MKQKKEPQIGDRRVYKCDHTFQETVQTYVEDLDGKMKWVCSHQDTDEEDAIEVSKFKQQNKKQ